MGEPGRVLLDREARAVEERDQVLLGVECHRAHDALARALQEPADRGVTGVEGGRVDAQLHPVVGLGPGPRDDLSVAVEHRGRTVTELLRQAVGEAPGELAGMVAALRGPDARGEQLHRRQRLRDGQLAQRPMISVIHVAYLFGVAGQCGGVNGQLARCQSGHGRRAPHATGLYPGALHECDRALVDRVGLALGEHLEGVGLRRVGVHAHAGARRAARPARVPTRRTPPSAAGAHAVRRARARRTA